MPGSRLCASGLHHARLAHPAHQKCKHFRSADSIHNSTNGNCKHWAAGPYQHRGLAAERTQRSPLSLNCTRRVQNCRGFLYLLRRILGPQPPGAGHSFDSAQDTVAERRSVLSAVAECSCCHRGSLFVGLSRGGSLSHKLESKRQQFIRSRGHVESR